MASTTAFVAVVSLTGGCSDSVESPPARTGSGDSLEFRAALTDLEDGLELHWTFEDRSGSQITDISGNGRHGTLQSGSFVSSPWGEAVSLDGVDDYISLVGPRDPAIYGGVNGSFTISTRVRVEDVNKLNTLCFGCGPFGIMYIGTPAYGPEVLSGIYNQDTEALTWPNSTDALEDDTWVSVTMIVEGGVGTRYYLDCQLDRTIPNEDVGLKDYNFSSVGHGSASDRWFGGEIDDLRIWSRALTDNELKLVCADPAEPLCSGAPEGPSLVDPPIAPGVGYDPPQGYSVFDAEELEDAITAQEPIIILEDGFYDHADLNNGDYLNIKAQHLWAANFGGAVLNFGINAGAYDATGAYANPELHGLVFDIDDIDHVVDPKNAGAAFYAWGDAHAAVVEDCIFNGNGVVPRAISLLAYDDVSIARVRIENFTRFGIQASSPSAGEILLPMSITDVWMRNIMDPACWGSEWLSCGYHPGTQENGLFIGDQVFMDRIFVRDVRSAAIVLVHNVHDSVLSNLDLDRLGVGHNNIGVGVYFEAKSRTTTVENFCVGPISRVGVNSEWDHCPSGPNPVGSRGIDNVVQDGLIQSHLIGVSFDQGTVNGLVQDTIFRNYSHAGIVFYKNLDEEPDPEDPVCSVTYSSSASTQQNNTFDGTETEGERCHFSRSIWNAPPSCE